MIKSGLHKNMHVKEGRSTNEAKKVTNIFWVLIQMNSICLELYKFCFVHFPTLSNQQLCVILSATFKTLLWNFLDVYHVEALNSPPSGKHIVMHQPGPQISFHPESVLPTYCRKCDSYVLHGFETLCEISLEGIVQSEHLLLHHHCWSWYLYTFQILMNYHCGQSWHFQRLGEIS